MMLTIMTVITKFCLLLLYYSDGSIKMQIIEQQLKPANHIAIVMPCQW